MDKSQLCRLMSTLGQVSISELDISELASSYEALLTFLQCDTIQDQLSDDEFNACVEMLRLLEEALEQHNIHPIDIVDMAEQQPEQLQNIVLGMTLADILAIKKSVLENMPSSATKQKLLEILEVAWVVKTSITGLPC